MRMGGKAVVDDITENNELVDGRIAEGVVQDTFAKDVKSGEREEHGLDLVGGEFLLRGQSVTMITEFEVLGDSRGIVFGQFDDAVLAFLSAFGEGCFEELGASGEVVCVDEHFFLVFAD